MAFSKFGILIEVEDNGMVWCMYYIEWEKALLFFFWN